MLKWPPGYSQHCFTQDINVFIQYTRVQVLWSDKAGKSQKTPSPTSYLGPVAKGYQTVVSHQESQKKKKSLLIVSIHVIT